MGEGQNANPQMFAHLKLRSFVFSASAGVSSLPASDEKETADPKHSLLDAMKRKPNGNFVCQNYM